MTGGAEVNHVYLSYTLYPKPEPIVIDLQPISLISTSPFPPASAQFLRVPKYRRNMEGDYVISIDAWL